MGSATASLRLSLLQVIEVAADDPDLGLLGLLKCHVYFAGLPWTCFHFSKKACSDATQDLFREWSTTQGWIHLKTLGYDGGVPSS